MVITHSLHLNPLAPQSLIFSDLRSKRDNMVPGFLPDLPLDRQSSLDERAAPTTHILKLRELTT